MTGTTDLDGRIALVTGAGRGIGRAIALELVTAGAGVVLTARTVDELDAVVAEIRAGGGEAVAVPCDLADRSQSTTVVERAASALGPIDVLVNNAGVGEDVPLAVESRGGGPGLMVRQ